MVFAKMENLKACLLMYLKLAREDLDLSIKVSIKYKIEHMQLKLFI
jgi:hypothetical protein